MKVRYGLGCVTLLIAALFQANSTLLAQDVAAAARANRASHASHDNAAAVKADSEWYSPTRASIHAQDQGVSGTILYEISSHQHLNIPMVTEKKANKQN